MQERGRAGEALDLTFKDISILAEIYRQESISAACEAINLSQPSISLRLNRLRAHFGDPLFVRTGQKMLPTSRMTELIPLIQQALALIEGSFEREVRFDPATTDRPFRIGMTDLAQVMLMPGLLAFLREAVPGARIEVSLFEVATPEALKLGTMDVAIGLHRQKMPQDLLQQTLFSVDYVCICSKGHPRLGDRIDMEDYLREAHVAVGYPGRTDNVYVTTLNDVGPTPRIAARVPSFRGAVSLVEATDMLAIVPRQLVQSIAAPKGIRQVALPFPIPQTAMNQYWHARYHRDPASIWLRQAIMELVTRPLRY